MYVLYVGMCVIQKYKYLWYVSKQPNFVYIRLKFFIHFESGNVCLYNTNFTLNKMKRAHFETMMVRWHFITHTLFIYPPGRSTWKRRNDKSKLCQQSEHIVLLEAFMRRLRRYLQSQLGRLYHQHPTTLKPGPSTP